MINISSVSGLEPDVRLSLTDRAFQQVKRIIAVDLDVMAYSLPLLPFISRPLRPLMPCA